MASLADFSERLSIDIAFARGSDGAPVLQADEELSCSYEAVSAHIADGSHLGNGVLYLTTRRVIWVSNQQPEKAMALSYKQIVMHAVSRDVESFPQQCIYLQLDEGDMMEGMLDEDEDEEVVVPDVRLVPSDAQQLDNIFKTLCDCAALNPDTDIEDDAAGDFYFNEAEVMAALGPEERAAFLAQQVNFAVNISDDAHQDDDRYEEDEEDGGPAGQNGHIPS